MTGWRHLHILTQGERHDEKSYCKTFQCPVNLSFLVGFLMFAAAQDLY